MKEPASVNQYRNRTHPVFKTDDSYGMNGVFEIPCGPGIKKAICIASNGSDAKAAVPWEHVSVHIESAGEDMTPDWDQMCYIKSLFWRDDECVVQYHPARKDYKNLHGNVLHLWNKKDSEFPMAPITCV